MAEKYLIVVDMQEDFVYGALGSEEAGAIAGRVVEKVKKFAGRVIFTKDTHGENYLKTQEGKNLPVKHCVKGSGGWNLIGELAGWAEEMEAEVYEKGTFGCVELGEKLRVKYYEGEIESIELIGVCTDICVVSNALLLKAYMPEVPMIVDADCCAGVTREKHEAALETMRSCQIQII